MKQLHQTHKNAQHGQSLVEVALFFPIFIILLAGLVEVSQLLVTQNRVSSAARASTRFAADGGQDEGMVTVVLNNVTQTLQTEENVWDIWSIRATVNAQGNGFSDWQFTQIYGISNTVRAPELDEDAIRTRVINELRTDELNNTPAGIAAGLRIVGTYTIHDVESILGLDAMEQLAGFSSLEALSVMRITANTQNATNGCAAFPIAVHEGARSVSAPGTGSNPYPNAGDFTYPSNPPVYQSFPNHTDDVALLDAQEGDVFRVFNGVGSGNFGWLLWNVGVSPNANTLENSLTWPGDSTDYTPCCGGSSGVPNSGFTYNVPGYIDPQDPGDHAIHIDDLIAANTGTVNSSGVRNALQSHINLDRNLRLIVWSEAVNDLGTPVPQNGSNARYRVAGFAVFRLVGYNLSQGWILAEFIRWDNSCGQVN
ncbi:MAG: TadE/TadG family type IV pilus assembly protein [Chloroflexota bacterium]